MRLLSRCQRQHSNPSTAQRILKSVGLVFVLLLVANVVMGLLQARWRVYLGVNLGAVFGALQAKAIPVCAASFSPARDTTVAVHYSFASLAHLVYARMHIRSRMWVCAVAAVTLHATRQVFVTSVPSVRMVFPSKLFPLPAYRVDVVRSSCCPLGCLWSSHLARVKGPFVCGPLCLFVPLQNTGSITDVSGGLL